MNFISRKTFFEVLTIIWTNVTSGWFGVIVVAPGIFGVKTKVEFISLLTINLLLGIVGFILSLFLHEKAKKL